MQPEYVVTPGASSTFASRKKIDKMEVIESLNLLIVMSGGDLSVHDMGTLSEMTTSLSVKKINLFCVNQIGSGKPCRICVAGMYR